MNPKLPHAARLDLGPPVGVDGEAHVHPSLHGQRVLVDEGPPGALGEEVVDLAPHPPLRQVADALHADARPGAVRLGGQGDGEETDHSFAVPCG